MKSKTSKAASSLKDKANELMQSGSDHQIK